VIRPAKQRYDKGVPLYPKRDLTPDLLLSIPNYESGFSEIHPSVFITSDFHSQHIGEGVLLDQQLLRVVRDASLDLVRGSMSMDMTCTRV